MVASQVPLQFAPPPTRDRSSSRTRPRFGLSALRNISSDRSNSQESSNNNSTPPSRDPSRSGLPTSSAADPLLRPTFARRTNVNSAANRASVYVQPTEPLIDAPAARRSASAGAPSPSQANAIPANWQASGAVVAGGFQVLLPPPPPGPPPPGGSNSRSASVSAGEDRLPGNDVPILSMPRRLRKSTLMMAPTLDPVPPTPAGWTDQPRTPAAVAGTSSSGSNSNGVPNGAAGRGEGASSERSYTSSSERLSHGEDSGGSSGFRRVERRDTTVKGIRERRSESRAAKDRAVVDSEETPVGQKPSDLVLNITSPTISRQGAVKKPRSSMSPKAAPLSANLRMAGRRSTMADSAQPGSPMPGSGNFNGSYSAPATGIQPGSFPRKDILEKGQPSGRPSSRSGKLPLRTPVDKEFEAFAKDSARRHHEFIEKESQATSGKERLELFAAYVVMESRLRRGRYSDAFSALSASDILDLTRDLWRRLDPPPQSQPTSATRAITPLNRPVTDRTKSFDSQTSSSPMSSRAEWTPRTESESPQNKPSLPTARDNNARSYQPVLSPIPSMAMSTAQDELESRGRSKSRWWESDSGSVGNPKKLERSKRESKYMGLHPEARFNLQFDDEPSPPTAGSGTPGRAGPSSEYPPEKVGWHDDEGKESQTTPVPYYSVPNTPSATAGLDVSRLVTLPPPHPRHYPAMSNSHPDLATFRTTIRQLNEISDIQDKRAAFTTKITRQRAVAAQESAAREAQMHHNITEQVRLGQMSYAAAAQAEDSFRARESKAKQAALRAEFDAFAPQVQTPLHALLSERLTRANACIMQLRDGLSDAAAQQPDAPLDEGDERPELLEKLKLIKWLVEAREVLHRQVFDLEAERSTRFRDLVLADMRDRGESDAKVADAEIFFQKDALDRWAAYERDTRARLEDLQGVVQKHVDRGVQDQLNAFWDIAPRLLEVVQRIPTSEEQLDHFQVSVPHKEISENPVYAEFPLQYLYGLLCHAEKATYQFIENQVGLMCLAHEVGMVLMGAGIRVLKTERCLEEKLQEGDEGLESEMAETAEFEERRLTRELKDRVTEVEGQWEQALGKSLSACLEHVESVLKEAGGWDESLKD